MKIKDTLLLQNTIMGAVSVASLLHKAYDRNFCKHNKEINKQTNDDAAGVWLHKEVGLCSFSTAVLQ